MAAHIDFLLGKTSLPLSFIVVIPEGLDKLAGDKMMSSPFFRKDLILVYGNHQYVSGYQHLSGVKDNLYTSSHTTQLFFFQNDAGFALWPPTSEKIRKLKATLEVLTV